MHIYIYRERDMYIYIYIEREICMYNIYICIYQYVRVAAPIPTHHPIPNNNPPFRRNH